MFKKIPDGLVLHVWIDQETDELVSVSPSFYENSGTPINPETGDDLIYSHTEIDVEKIKQFL